jgi:hypothetical protein
VDFPREVRAHVMPASSHALENRVEPLLFQRRFAAELRVEIRGGARHGGEFVIDLVIDRHLLVIEV